MIVMNSSSTEKCKCVICGRVEGNSLIYKDKGIEVKMPLCHVCMEKKSKAFDDNIKSMMRFRINQIKGYINTEKFLTFNEQN